MKVQGQEIEKLIREVFATDEDLYLRRQHSDNKTLDGLVEFTMSSLFDDSPLSDVEVYTYGDRYGFFAVNQCGLLRSFGIKKEHRDKKDLFWSELKMVIGEDVIACVWSENINARRFFESKGELLNEQDNMVAYKLKL